MTHYQITYYDIHGNVDRRVLVGVNGNATDAACAIFGDVDIHPDKDDRESAFVRPVITFAAVYAN